MKVLRKRSMFEIVPVTSLADAAMTQRPVAAAPTIIISLRMVFSLLADIPITRHVETNPVLRSEKNESPPITSGCRHGDVLTGVPASDRTLGRFSTAVGRRAYLLCRASMGGS